MTRPHPPLAHTTLDTPVGQLCLVGSDAGLRAVLWEDDHGRVPGTEPLPPRDDDHPVLAEAARQIAEYFAGERTDFDLPLDLVGTEFQVAAWRALADIPYGRTATYAQQADRIGRPTATRAVGAANGRNPVSIVLPCHRVVGADGSLTGFAGGLANKRLLLDLEQGRRPLLA